MLRLPAMGTYLVRWQKESVPSIHHSSVPQLNDERSWSVALVSLGSVVAVEPAVVVEVLAAVSMCEDHAHTSR